MYLYEEVPGERCGSIWAPYRNLSWSRPSIGLFVRLGRKPEAKEWINEAELVSLLLDPTLVGREQR